MSASATGSPIHRRGRVPDEFLRLAAAYDEATMEAPAPPLGLEPFSQDLEDKYGAEGASMKPDTPEGRQQMELLCRIHDLYIASPANSPHP